MLTEQEAREKWCPFARTTMYVRGDVPEAESPTDMIGHAANRLVTDDVKLNASIQKIIKDVGATRCIASDCMAWRFRLQPTKYRKIPNDLYVPAEWENAGYCGLAGKPDA